MQILESIKWLVLVLVLAIIFMIMFRSEIATSLKGGISIKKGDLVVDLNTPTKGKIDLTIEGIAGEQKIEYLRRKLGVISEELDEIRTKEFYVAGTPYIFLELIRIIEATQSSICSVNHRYQVWFEKENPLSFVYEDYLRENDKAAKKGVAIKRLWVIPENTLKDPRVAESLRKQKQASVDIQVITKEKIQHIVAYQNMLKGYNEKKFGISFDEVNLAVYDDQIMVHTVAYASEPAYKVPTRLRISWRKDEVAAFNPCTLLKALPTGTAETVRP